MFPSFESVSEFLTWAIGPGLPIVVGFIVAYGLERFTFWHKLHSDLKAAIPFVIAGIVFVVGTYTLGVSDIVDNVNLDALFKAILFYAASQAGYAKFKAPSWKVAEKLSRK